MSNYYLGENRQGKSLPEGLDFNRAEIVVVTAMMPNICGHVLLYIGGGLGHYFHFTGPELTGYPLYLTGPEFKTYLQQSGKKELARRRAEVPHPERAAAQLAQLMSREWTTLILSHNCASFVGLILNAGGNFQLIPSHCPIADLKSVEWWERIFGPIREKLGTQKDYEGSYLH